MKILIKQAKIIIPQHPLNGKTLDVLIDEGNIVAIEKEIASEKATVVLEEPGQCLSLGWFDFRANYAEPGFEHRETLSNGLEVASKSGFTAVGILPSTQPIVDNKSLVKFIQQKSQHHLVDLYPYGSITVGMNGEALAEMHDMSQAGAVAFTDDKKALMRNDLVKLALQYSDNIQKPILLHCSDSYLNAGTQMHEGPTSTHTALKGEPSISESITIQRYLSLAEYTQAPVHLSTISSAEGVALIREAKAKGIAVTADCSIAHLSFCDEDLAQYPVNLKIQPPLRGDADRKALIEAVLDGTIDVVCSDHLPKDVEVKSCEFALAEPGMVSQETFCSAISHLQLDWSAIIPSFTTKPREILGLDLPSFETGAEANLTVFHPDLEWDCDPAELQSNCKNSPYLHQKLKGMVSATFANGQVETY